jgi:hypothetical protein
MPFTRYFLGFLALVLAGCGKTNSGAGKEEDQVRLDFIRQEKQWKVSLAMPKVAP